MGIERWTVSKLSVVLKSTLKWKIAVSIIGYNVCLSWVKRNVNFVIHPCWIFATLLGGPQNLGAPGLCPPLSIGCDATARILLTCKLLFVMLFLDDCKLSTSLTLNPNCSSDSKSNLHNSFNTTHSACNFGFMFDEYHHLFRPNFISVQILQLPDLLNLPCLDSTTDCTTVTSTVHSKLDYWNSLYYDLPKCQIGSEPSSMQCCWSS